MNKLQRIGVSILVCSFSGLASAGSALEALSGLAVGQSTVLDGVPLSANRFASVQVRRIDPYSADAKILLDQDGKLIELPRSSRRFFLAHTTSGLPARLALSTDAQGLDLQGQVFQPGADFELAWQGDIAKGQWRLNDSTNRIPAGQTPTFQCGNTPQVSLQDKLLSDSARAKQSLGVSAINTDVLNDELAAPLPEAVLATRTATIAFDIDSNAITKKFGGNNTTANNFTASLITAMNASYDSPLNVQLLLGTTIIRTAGTDPYSGTTDTGVQLDLLGARWRDNHAGVTRAFVMLISGVQANGCSASGLAWVDAYCRTGTAGTTNVYGSYSANQLFHSACGSLGISNDVRITAHELGHNFGADHTHCTSAGGGAFLDQCFNGESGFGCYAGTQSCPAPGGTLMSYCHLLGSCTTSLLFHPTHISIITPKTNAAFTAGCLRPATGGDNLFANGFE